MIEGFDASLLIEINKEFSSGVVLDRNGLEGAIARPWTSVYGHEPFGTPWAKAGALFHGIASTQYFQDGNKRTAWVAAELLLNELGCDLKSLPTINYETFALSVASLTSWNAEKASEWYENNMLTTADKVDYCVLGVDSAVDYPAPGLWSGRGINVYAFEVPHFPFDHQIDCITRIKWRESDAGTTPEFQFAVRGSEESHSSAFRIKAIIQGKEATVVARSGHSHHEGVMPVIYQYGLVLEILGPGIATIDVSCDGVKLRELPVAIHEPVNVDEITVQSFV